MTVITAAPSSNPQRAKRRWRRLRAALCVAALVAASGCVSTQQRGDRAFQSGLYTEALDHYEHAIDAGDVSPQLYANAAQAALRIGDFSLAERYFSRALRDGGGEVVARELADFYIATSNYTKAVRVLQTVLETTDDPQTVFNDLGAALMYAGSPLNAESYLLVAQQMQPDDPVPYVNLGVLYDKHLHKPRLAYGFYQCFLELSPKSRQSGKVRARLVSLEARFNQDFPAGYQVDCAEPYQPSESGSVGLKSEVERRLAEREDEPEKDAPEPSTPAEKVENIEAIEPDEQAGGDVDIPIHRGVTEPLAAPEPPAEKPVRKEKPSEENHEEAVALAEKAFANHNHQEVVDGLKELPADAMTTSLMGIYGQSLAAIGEFERARRWLTAAIAEAPAPPEVLALWTTYQKLNKSAEARALCERFEGSSGYSDLLKACATAADRRDDAR